MNQGKQSQTPGTTGAIAVVGLGGSAGALASLQAFFEAMPPESGAAFIVIVHHPPTHETLLPTLLARHTRMAVVEACDGASIVADHIYVLPGGKSLSVLDGTLTVQDVTLCQGLRMPIDHFFCTLAADEGRRSIGIILSGSGTDGTQGLAELRAAGGATVVQDPRTAEFPDMPASAIAAGHADAVLSPVKMAAFLTGRLAELARLTEEQQETVGLEAVLAAVRHGTGHNFHCYKRATLERRTRRRMALHHLESYDDYAHFVRTNNGEAVALRKDLLIGVTEFFRQPDAWIVLEEKVVTDLIQKAQPECTLRVWVPACSTGKEAYSVAMLLVESIERSGKNLALQIFATDADASAVEIARSGVYAEDDLKGLSQARLDRFCARVNGRYEMVKELRSLIVFAPQDLTADPPFSKVDLVTCRNLLIYLDQAAQRKIIQVFHFALREGGYLFLGSAETLSGQDNLFEPVSQKWRLYRKLGVAIPVGLELPQRPQSRPAVTIPAPIQRPRLTLLSITNQALAERYAPATAVVDRKGALLYTHGDVREFLELPLGEHTGLLVDTAREGMRHRLAGALLQAVTENKRIVAQARVKRGKTSIPVKMTVSPLRQPREADGLLLVSFEALRPAREEPAAVEDGTPPSDVRQLEDELKITREELQSTIQQLEHSNEHMKASNEEVSAANEELQSANEELETSKEELQSLNEELNAVNLRLQEKVGELEQTGNDVSNLLTSGAIATLFLDRELKVRRFTPAITKLLSLVETDLGRPIADIHRKFADQDLLSEVRRVLKDLTSATDEVQTEEGAWYSRRILPYRTQDDRIEGVVITFNDVTDLKQLSDALRCSEESARQKEEQNRFLADLLERSDQPFGVGYPDGMLGVVNGAFERLTGYSREELKSMDWANVLTPPKWHELERAKLDELHRSGKPVRYEKEYCRKDGTLVPIELLVHLVTDEKGQPKHYFSFLTDLTDRKQADEALRTSEERHRRLAEEMKRIMDVAPVAIWVANDPQCHDIIGNRMANRFYEAQEGENVSAGPAEGTTDQTRRFFRDGLELRPEELPMQEAVAKDVDVRDSELHVQLPSGRWMVMLGHASPLRDAEGNVRGCVGAFIDITERKRAEEEISRRVEELRVANEELENFNVALRASEERYRLLFQSLQEGFYLAEAIFDDHGACCDAVYVDANPAFERLMGLPRDQIIGKRARELVPGIKPEWLEVFGRVTQTGEGMSHETYSEVFGKTFEAFVFRPEPGRFGVLVSDITERKRAEEEIRQSVEELRVANEELESFNAVAVGRELRMIELKKQVNELCVKAGLPPPYEVEEDDQERHC